VPSVEAFDLEEMELFLCSGWLRGPLCFPPASPAPVARGAPVELLP